jgi:hypothetical protein
MVVVKSFPQTILDHQVNQGAIVHSISIAGIGQGKGSHAHIFHPTGYYYINITGFDQLGGQANCS